MKFRCSLWNTHSPSASITAPEAGLYSAVVDGYETVLTPEALEELTPGRLARLEPDEDVLSAPNVGKLVLGDAWYYAAAVDEETARTLQETKGLKLRFAKGVSRDLDAVPILDKFVEEHPDFSPFGAKGCLSLTGYEGILGYRTQTDTQNWTDAQEANRQKEIEAVKPIIAELKRTGWTFGSHTWGHIRLGGSRSMAEIQTDTQKWFDEVGSLVGETNVLFYPHGERPDGDDWQKTGEVFQYLQSQGFRIFCSVGIESFSYIKKDISAVICDRLHPDGTTLRSKYVDDRYGQFYDVREIIDLDVRPDLGVGWS